MSRVSIFVYRSNSPSRNSRSFPVEFPAKAKQVAQGRRAGLERRVIMRIAHASLSSKLLKR